MIPGYLSPLVNHLWQSTLFAVVAGLLAVALRRNRAAVRYWLWLAASVKFLIPLSWLVAIGNRFEWRTAPVMAPTGWSAAEQILIHQAFGHGVSPVVSPTSSIAFPIPIPELLVAMWVCGVATVLCCWWRQWRPIRAALHRATPLNLEASAFTHAIDVMSTPDLCEPGIVGVRHPALLLPEGIVDRLPPAQLRAILAHELCHVRRRDNLAAAIHMMVEAIYWFHPLVWWLEVRLVDERERACDEEVLRMGSDPGVYAEGILRTGRSHRHRPCRAAD